MNDHFHHCLGEESARHWWVLGEVSSNEEGDSAERDIVVHSLAKSTVKSGKDHRRNVGKLINDDKQQVFHVQFITEIFELCVSERWIDMSASHLLRFWRVVPELRGFGSYEK
jgi:D-alanine-D-alanine ligase-like ATP-grasp enzyme